MSYRKSRFVKVLEPIKKGSYFYFTIPYGIFYICGAIAGYVRDKSNLCLGVSGSIGVVFVLLGKPFFLAFHAVIRYDLVESEDFHFCLNVILL
jgi:hypothetical protein